MPDDDEIDIVSVRHTPQRRQLTRSPAANRSDDDDDSDFEPIQRSARKTICNLSGAAPSSSPAAIQRGTGDGVDMSDQTHAQDPDYDDDDVVVVPNGPRRSTRIRNRPAPFSTRGGGGRRTDGDDGGNGNENGNDEAPDDNETPNRLEQIDCISPEEFGLDQSHPTCRLRITVHPVAMAMISFHAHLSRTEVIGYLGGAVSPCLSEGDGMVDVVISESFPAQGLADRVLARSGRNAFSEVEIDPESSVEVMGRVQTKGLQVVGWYHSHPDASFTVQPSRVDIENQANYQTFIFKDTPFVAAIIAPYNENLPDHNPDVQFFLVHDEQIPLKLPFSVAPPDPRQRVPSQLAGYLFASPLSPFPIDDFVNECLSLVVTYGHFPKRVRLEREWRESILNFDKLRQTLNDLIEEDVESNGNGNGNGNNSGGDGAQTMPIGFPTGMASSSTSPVSTSPTGNSDGQASGSGNADANASVLQSAGLALVKNRQAFLDAVKLVMDQVEERWTESGRIDDEKRERNRQASKKKKRQRRR